MEFDLSEGIAVLSRTPATLNSLLANMPEAWTHTNEGADTWSPYDVVGHLIHGEQTDWIPRTRIILEHGKSKTFEPFDRFAQLEKSKGKTLGDLLKEFQELRRQSLQALEEMNIKPEQLSLRGSHPELGEVTLAQLLATWVVHDVSHIAQVARIMCKQYSNEVGPWKQYLPILQ